MTSGQMNAFLTLCGDITIAEIVQLVMALGFLLYVASKVKAYFIKKAEAEKAKENRLAKALETTEKFDAFSQNVTLLSQRLEETIERLGKLEQRNADSECAKLRESIFASYRRYAAIQRNPALAWTRMEADAFWELFKAYEQNGGNGYVHQVIQPEMTKLTIIEMDETEAIAELMAQRK